MTMIPSKLSSLPILSRAQLEFLSEILTLILHVIKVNMYVHIAKRQVFEGIKIGTHFIRNIYGGGNWVCQYNYD